MYLEIKNFNLRPKNAISSTLIMSVTNTQYHHYRIQLVHGVNFVFEVNSYL